LTTDKKTIFNTMPPKGKRKRNSTGSITESEKRLRLEDVKENARRLREERAKERIRELQNSAPASPVESEPDEEFFEHLELLDENLKQTCAEDIRSVPPAPFNYSQKVKPIAIPVTTRYSDSRPSYAPVVQQADVVAYSSDEDLESVGPFSANAMKLNSSSGRRASAPSSAVTKREPPRSKPRYSEDAYETIGLIPPAASQIHEPVGMTLASHSTASTTPTTKIMRSPADGTLHNAEESHPATKSFVSNYVVVFALIVAFIGIMAFEYFNDEECETFQNLLRATSRNVKWGFIIAIALVATGLVAYIIYYFIQRRNNEKRRCVYD
jgi:hypothetical protein